MGRYYIQGESVRGESRVYWVCDRYQRGLFSVKDDRRVSEYTTDKRQAQRWMDKLLDQSAAVSSS